MESTIQALIAIDSKMSINGFKKTKSEKGWRIWTLGDNYFVLTKRFARLEIRNMKGKIVISALVASVYKDGDKVSKIDWVETKKLNHSNFPVEAKKVVKNLFLNMKSVKELFTT